MRDTSVASRPPGLASAEYLAREVAILAGRLADLLHDTPVASEASIATGIDFLRGVAQPVAGERSLSERVTVDAAVAGHPLERVAAAYAFAPVEIDLLLLAGMAEEHEGFASLFRALHPRDEPRPTVGLAAQLFCGPTRERLALRALITRGAAVRSGALIVGDDGPFFERTLSVGDAVWPALAGVNVWPTGITVIPTAPTNAGVADWLESERPTRACAALYRGSPVMVLVLADDDLSAVHRAASLARHADVTGVALTSAGPWTESLERLVALHALIRDAVPILRLVATADGPTEVPTFHGAPGPVILCAREGTVAARGPRPVFVVPVERLSARTRGRLWNDVLPELSADARTLGACFALEPHVVLDVAADVQSRAALEHRLPTFSDVAECIRARTNLSLAAGVRIVHPTARWEHLVLPVERRRQLREAIDRLLHQGRVLDDWGFLAGRPGARGVRMLFAGPPGTGKTLAAEVLAESLGVDLLVVDLARVVSKWIGETEKNLAEVFDAAERVQAVLLFDEADALFGKRTEVTDAHDRYANLETAYLLSRLERFEGLSILSTNLRENIDAAFTRRLEFVVEFDEPSVEEREALWRCHLPSGAPLAPDVRVAELASLYPIVGGVIRNASVAAGFLASAADGPITRTDLVRAVRREYEKMGRAFPGAPAGTLTL